MLKFRFCKYYRMPALLYCLYSSSIFHTESSIYTTDSFQRTRCITNPAVFIRFFYNRFQTCLDASRCSEEFTVVFKCSYMSEVLSGIPRCPQVFSGVSDAYFFIPMRL